MDYAEEYTKLHEEAGGKWFMGSTIKRYVNDIADLISLQQPRNILDYGSGKGMQYLLLRLHERWGGMLPYCYDVGVRQLAVRPEIKFDGIISTDMMEHIEEPDIPKILDDVFGFLTPEDRPKFIFLSIACRPDSKTERQYDTVFEVPAADMSPKRLARMEVRMEERLKKRGMRMKGVKRLLDGRDLHVTIKPPDWWIEQVLQTRNRSVILHPQLKIRMAFELMDGSLVRREVL